jgi:endonuclease/exonuclease/phosphatase family metal-dependent hydrolase
VTAGAAKTARRRRQCETIARLVEAELRPDSPFLIVGDMNDTPDSDALQPLAQSDLVLVDALADPQETRPAKADVPAPLSKAWTHRFRESGQPSSYELFDQIWLSPALNDNLSESWIDRRTKHSGDGSDHDPAWVVLDL